MHPLSIQHYQLTFHLFSNQCSPCDEKLKELAYIFRFNKMDRNIVRCVTMRGGTDENTRVGVRDALV
jgi:hypothetical protein